MPGATTLPVGLCYNRDLFGCDGLVAALPADSPEIFLAIVTTKRVSFDMVYMNGIDGFIKALAAPLAATARSVKDLLTQTPWDRLARFQPVWTTTHEEPPLLEAKLGAGQSGMKAGVIIDGLHPIMFAAWVEVVSCFAHFDKPCIVTSGLDGKHSKNSLHYEGLALDFRTRHLTPTERAQIRGMIKRKLDTLAEEYNATSPNAPVRFDVVLERTHIHVEADDA